jgi:ketosteroid isomerase-like protein
MLLSALGTAACTPAHSRQPAPVPPSPAAATPGTSKPAAGSDCGAIASPPTGWPSWVLGHWVQEDGTGSETWTAAGPALLGVGFATTSAGTSWFEVLIITEVDGVLTYTAIPGGQYHVDFSLAESDAESVLFANPAHDHPQRIRYRRHGEALSAEIESTQGGSRRWAWQPAETSPAAVLEEADRRFAADSAARGADAWAAVFAPDGLMWRRGRPLIVGPEAIRASLQPAFAEHLLAWQPHTSVLSPAGDMGFTIGCYQRQRRSPASPPAREEVGTYLTIWRRQADGTWLAVFDTGIPNTSR